MTQWKFTAKLFRPEGPRMMTVLPIPRRLVSKENLRARQRLKGMIDNVQIATSLLSNGDGDLVLVINKQILQELGKKPGYLVKVSVERDEGSVQVEVPPSFREGLEKDPKAKKVFDQLSPSHRKEYALWISSAKKTETIDRRIRKAIEMLHEGKTIH